MEHIILREKLKENSQFFKNIIIYTYYDIYYYDLFEVFFELYTYTLVLFHISDASHSHIQTARKLPNWRHKFCQKLLQKSKIEAAKEKVKVKVRESENSFQSDDKKESKASDGVAFFIILIKIGRFFFYWQCKEKST